MFWFLYILLAFIIISLLLLVMMAQVFNVTPIPHKNTPAKFSIPFKEIQFPTVNNCNLYGWWMPQVEQSTQNKTLILVHGWKRNVGRMLPYIEPLYNAGFNLLVFDARNHGSSDSDKVASMPKFTEDIRAAMDYLQRIPGFEKVQAGVIGLSLGAAAAIYAASKDERISQVVAVGAFASPDDVMILEVQKRHVPYFPFGWMIMEYAQFRIGLRFKVFAPVNNIGKVKVPVLLVHGKNDETAPFSQAEKLVDASSPKTTQLWAIDGKGHSDCHLEPGFWDRLIEFLNRA